MRYITTWETKAEAVFGRALWKSGKRVNSRTANTYSFFLGDGGTSGLRKPAHLEPKSAAREQVRWFNLCTTQFLLDVFLKGVLNFCRRNGEVKPFVPAHLESVHADDEA